MLCITIAKLGGCREEKMITFPASFRSFNYDYHTDNLVSEVQWMIIDGDSYDTIFMTLPALFITDFERYYNQVKTEIEDNNKAAEAEYRVWEKNNSEILDKEKETELEKDKGEYLRLKKKLEEAGVKL